MKKDMHTWSVCKLGAVLAIFSLLFLVRSADRRHLFTPSDVKRESVSTMVSVQGHPRLFFDANEVPALKTRATTTHQQIWIPIRNYVNSQLGTSPPATAPPSGDLNTYRNYGNRLIPFAFACVISGDSGHCDLAKTYLLTYASWRQWDENNCRDLGLGHMLLGNAIAYDWLYDILTPTQRQTVRTSLAAWAQKMYEASAAASYQASWCNWWRKAYLQNHNWINHSGLGMAALALFGEDDRAQMWLDQASNRMSVVRDVLNEIKGASWHESIPYQSYALTLSLPFLVNLRKIGGVELLPQDYLRDYSYWRIFNHIPNSTQFILAYGDFDWSWANGYIAQNVLRFIANNYSDGGAEWMAQQLIANEGRSANLWSTPWYVFEFLYYNPSVMPQPPTDLQKARTFPDLEGIIWRTGWGTNDLIFGLKTGAYGGRFAYDTYTQGVYPWEPPCAKTGCELSFGHDHEDSNGFYIHKSGRWLAPEVEGYHVRTTTQHNTLLIDGQGQYRPPDTAEQSPAELIGSDGFLEVTANTPNFDYVAADATRRYKNIAGVQDVTRYVVFIRPNYFVMLDNLTAESAHQYEWVSHFGESVSIEGNWIRGDAGGGQILGVGVAAPQPFVATTGNDGRPYVRIRPGSVVDDVRFINILYPTDNDSWNARPTVATLGYSGTAVAVTVRMNDGSRRTDDVLFTYAQAVSTSVAGPYASDARVAVVSRGVSDKPERLFIFDGTFLKDQTTGRVYVANLDRGEPFEAVYSDETVAVYGNIRTEVALYAPYVNRLMVNGVQVSFARCGEYITFKVNAG